MRRLTMMCAALGALVTLGTAQAEARSWNHHQRHYGWERGHHYGWNNHHYGWRHHRPVYGLYRHHPRAWHHHGHWR